MSLHRWSRLSELQCKEIWFTETFPWSSLNRPQHKEVLQPIWTRSPLPPRCIRIVPTLGKDPWSRLSKCRRHPLEDCALVALRYSRVFSILGNAALILSRLHTCLAKRIHSAKLLHGYGMPCSVLHKARSDNAQEFSGSHKAGHNCEVDHQHRPWTDRGRPKGEICWGELGSSCLLLEVCI